VDTPPFCQIDTRALNTPPPPPPPRAQVGDGTTTVVILSGEFLREAKPYVEEGVHPRVSSGGRTWWR